jgi:hypothetical protein
MDLLKLKVDQKALLVQQDQQPQLIPHLIHGQEKQERLDPMGHMAQVQLLLMLQVEKVIQDLTVMQTALQAPVEQVEQVDLAVRSLQSLQKL